MKTRNVKAIIDGVQVSPYYDINLEEMMLIMDMARPKKEGTFDTISLADLVAFAFRYGYAMGHRAAIAESRKGAKAWKK